MQYQIIACDLDGTLLDETGHVSKENWEAIEKLTQMGVQVVPASGRAFEEMPKEIQDCPFIRYYIASNGAGIYDKTQGFIHEWTLPRELGHGILDLLTQYETTSLIHIGTKTYVDEATHSPQDYAKFNMNTTWQNYCMAFVLPIREPFAFAYEQESIQSFTTFFKHKEDLQTVWQLWEKDDRLALAQTDPFNIEVFSSQAGKGKALSCLADLLGIDKSATIAMGDSSNDLTMIRAAGLGLAMENAVPALKEAADATICHHKDHGLKYILEHYYL